jgi:hypothetical protein
MVGGSEAILRVLEVVSAANAEVRRRLETNERLMRALMVLVEDGTPLFTALESLDWVKHRQASDEAIRTLYESRRRLREIAVAVALDEGRSVAEIAASFDLNQNQIVGVVGEHSTPAAPPVVEGPAPGHG